MRSSLLSATLVLALSACGSSPDAGVDVDNPGGADAAAPAELDVCQWLTKEVADLILGGAAHDRRVTGVTAQVGGCSWRGAGDFDQLVISVNRTGTSAEFFAQACAGAQPPFPVIDNRGVGVAACGRAETVGANLLIQLDGTTTMFNLFSNVGTLDQAFEVVRAVAARIPPP